MAFVYARLKIQALTPILYVSQRIRHCSCLVRDTSLCLYVLDAITEVSAAELDWLTDVGWRAGPICSVCCVFFFFASLAADCHVSVSRNTVAVLLLFTAGLQ